MFDGSPPFFRKKFNFVSMFFHTPERRRSFSGFDFFCENGTEKSRPDAGGEPAVGAGGAGAKRNGGKKPGRFLKKEKARSPFRLLPSSLARNGFRAFFRENPLFCFFYF